MFEFYMIVDDSEIAVFASKNGVSRLFIDLEYQGKAERQKGLDTWKSHQSLYDVSRLREVAPGAHLLVRINPLNSGSKTEVDEAISRGADSLMLPMWNTADDISNFLDLVEGRVEVLPLVETVQALKALPDIVSDVKLDRVHFGLNDLHLQMKRKFMFELICDGTLDNACNALRNAGVKFGIGGIARAGEGFVSPEYLLGEHVRHGSTSAILSRTFHRKASKLAELQQNMNLQKELSLLTQIFMKFKNANHSVIEANHHQTKARVAKVIGNVIF
jgi:hypothetical protein